MGRPQLGFPRLRVRATDIAIGPRSYSDRGGPGWKSAHSGTGFAMAANTVIFSTSMAVSVEMQHAGDSGVQAEIRAIIEHVLADWLGDWRGLDVGCRRDGRRRTRVPRRRPH